MTKKVNSWEHITLLIFVRKKTSQILNYYYKKRSRKLIGKLSPRALD